MCLIIDTKIHNKGFSFPKPIRLERDLIVYKVLCYSYFYRTFVTPYMDYPITFSNGKCVLEALFGKESYKPKAFTENSMFCIRQGIHAYRSIPYYRSINSYSFKAVIPKGTFVYYGQDGDIVAQKMIILNQDIAVTAYVVDAK